MHLVVLAAGLGSRFGGLKQLESVGPHGEAIMDVLLVRAAERGFDHAVVIVRAEIEGTVEAHFNAFPPPVPHELVVQPVPANRDRPLGTAHAVLACRTELDGPFAVVNADDLYPADAFATLADHMATSNQHALVAFRLDRTIIGDRPVSRAVLTVAGHDLVGIAEHKAVTRSSMAGDQWASMNMWGFQTSIFETLERAVGGFVAAGGAGEVLLPDVAASMMAAGETVRVLPCEERCIGITYAEDVAVVRRSLE